MQHTPGPHRQYGKFVSDTLETMGGMYLIRTGADAGNEFLGAAVKQEDAKLWAAAPDLLAALSMLLEIRMEHGGDPAADAEVRIARAAIAKAQAR
jgi:hypothetical protein